MSRLIQYLIEGRSKQIDQREIPEFLHSNCSQALKQYKSSGYCIYRGLNSNSISLVTDPSKGQPRYSKGKIENYYTLLMDNLPNWKSYPKRSRSIICTNSLNDSRGYGETYVVFPFNNANFGVCPQRDIWDSFLQNINHLKIFCKTLKGVLDITTSKYNHDKDWKTLTKSFKESEDYIKSNNLPNTIYNKFKQSDEMWIQDIVNGKTYIETFKNYMDPSKNNFSLTKDPISITKDCELWTDSKCILVREKLINSIIPPTKNLKLPPQKI